MNKAIGVFDSGFGGVSALIALTQVLPNEQYIYYADNKNAPYGLKNNYEISQLSIDICNFLLNKNTKASVVACNTATSAAIDTLRNKYTIPIIGMEPAIKPALSLGGKTVILGTNATLRNRKLRKLIRSLSPKEEIVLLDGSKLVSYVEDFLLDTAKFQNILEDMLAYQLDAKNIVLGCTHFLFLKNHIKKILPDANIVDGHLGTAKRLKDILEQDNLLANENLNIEFYSSLGDQSAQKAKQLYENNKDMNFFEQ